MKILLIGSTGMLGQALYSKFIKEKFDIVTVARSHSNYKLDFLINGNKIVDIIKKEVPDIVINCAALVNLKYCEQNPGEAYVINARIPGLISLACQKTKSYFIQISTDHYYASDNKKQHTELDKVKLLNEYARTKYAGEVFTLNYDNSLVIRTNIVGFRNKPNNLTFVEWIIKSLVSKQTITGFVNYYTSSIDIYSFSEILRELMDYNVKGILNIAASDVISKYQFINSIAKHLGIQNLVSRGKLDYNQEILRAGSLGLDVNKLSNYIKDQTIPSSEEVIRNLVKKYKEGAFYEL